MSFVEEFSTSTKTTVNNRSIITSTMTTEAQTKQPYHDPKRDSFEEPKAQDHNPGRSPSAPSSAETSPKIDQGEWKPRHKARQYSFDAQEQKHKLQSRLTGLVKGKETGFTERDNQRDTR